MKLERYNQKRDFTKTKEPKGVPKKSKNTLQFVVQKHAASHLHYDFRLEIDGVLVSWAVPKGPSADPADKRLAVMTEDHPMAYLHFEGIIPAGEYGGGTVMVWDTGKYRPEGSEKPAEDAKIMMEQLKSGSIKVILEGGKLKGSWHLVQMKSGKNWLLMKAKDEFAGAHVTFDETSILSQRDFPDIEKVGLTWGEKKSNIQKPQTDSATDTADFTADSLSGAVKLTRFPTEWRPQLATLTDSVFDSEDWIFETKYDGYRALAQIQNNTADLISRNGNSFLSKYSAIAKALEQIHDNIILDGEIVVEDTKGISHFQWLQHYEDTPEKGVLKFYIFDILYFNGYDLRGLALLQRKKILKAILPPLENCVYSTHVSTTGTALFQAIQKEGGEGIIAKKKSSTYHTDTRTKDWLKVKTTREQEMVIGGYTDPQGQRSGLGALLCGYYKDATFVYAGKVGTGFSDDYLTALQKQLKKLEQPSCPFSIPPKIQNVHWVTPKLVAQIKFSEWTESGNMRHPVFTALRSDKDPKTVVRETIQSKIKKASKTKMEKKAKSSKVQSDKVTFTNLDKVFWPDEKISKGAVISYYEQIAPYLLPFLKDRPQSLRRNSDGISKPGFFQKNVAGLVPDWIKTRKLKSKSTDETIEYLLCQDKDSLLFLANWGCIELNPWSSRVGSINNPDYIIFDLDPNEADMAKLVATALKVKELLDRLKVRAYLKTSGGKGLHIFIPVLPKYTYEQSRQFSHLISQMVHRELPDSTSLERSPDKRKGKIYLDFLQNGKGKTMASVYSLRPRAGAPVSTPLEWEELHPEMDLKSYNIHTIIDRIATKGDLWKDFFDHKMDLKTILATL